MTRNLTKKKDPKFEKLDLQTLEEALSDVGIGFILSFPVGLITLSLCYWAELSVTLTAVVQTVVFTLVSLARKYYVRRYFKNKGY